MNKSACDEKQIHKLRAQDPKFPLLASQAAIELDNLIRGKKTELTAVRTLGSLLENSVTVDKTDQSYISKLDPTTTSVIGRAINESREAPFRTTSELIQEAVKIAETLGATSTDKEPNQLEGMRNFCASLALAASTYSFSIDDIQSDNPYRRL